MKQSGQNYFCAGKWFINVHNNDVKYTDIKMIYNHCYSVDIVAVAISINVINQLKVSFRKN